MLYTGCNFSFCCIKDYYEHCFVMMIMNSKVNSLEATSKDKKYNLLEVKMKFFVLFHVERLTNLMIFYPK